MINIIPANKRPSFAQSILGNIAENLPSAISEYNQERKLNSENEAIEKQLGLNLSGIRDPHARHTLLADQLAYGRKMKQAAGTQNVNYSQNQNEEPMPTLTKEKLPGFGQGSIKGKNISQGQESGIGNAPQPETTGVKRPIFNVDQLLQEGKRIAAQQSQAGIPTTPLEGFNIAKGINEENKAYNQEVESDVKQRVESQRNYGNIAVDKLLKVFPEATDEQQAYFKRKGEETSKNITSEAGIERELAKNARIFKNTLANIKKSLPAPRLLQNVKTDLLGESRPFDKVKNDIRIKLNPLLKEGLYDTARDLLSELGYHPEERESILTDLGENAKKELIKFPPIERPNTKSFTDKLLNLENYSIFTDAAKEEEYTPEQQEMIRGSLSNVLTSDPSTNLVLLRKAYEDKGVDWESFKDNLNDLIFNGEVNLNDDQFSQLDVLDSPPLNNLDKILFNLKLVGR